MEITIGRVTFEVEWFGDYVLSDETARATAEIGNPDTLVTLFRWDCQTQSGRPDPPPATFDVPRRVYFHLTGADGKVSKEGNEALVGRLMRRLGCATPKEMTALFAAAFPRADIAIPAATWYDKDRATHVFTVEAEIEFEYLILRARGMRPGDHFFLGMPKGVTLKRRGYPKCLVPNLPDAPELMLAEAAPMEMAEVHRRLLQVAENGRRSRADEDREERER